MPFVDIAIFANIDETTIVKCAMKTKGAGTSGLDAIGWRRMQRFQYLWLKTSHVA